MLSPVLAAALHMLHCSSCRGLCGGARLAVRDKRVRGVRGRLWLAGDATLLHTLRTLSSVITHTCVPCASMELVEPGTSGPSQSHPTHHPLTIHSPSTDHAARAALRTHLYSRYR